MAETEHDLFDFIRAATDDIAGEYQRIQKRAKDDPGTAGDEGEENWASILRDWLPPSYRVVTKGRILSDKGTAGPQVDVLVLHPHYPPFLVNKNKKVYLASGVLAAFECKVTLKAEHISAATQNSVAIKQLFPERSGSPYRELFSPIKYGLLAQSHAWTKPRSTPLTHVSAGLDEADKTFVQHPRESVDLVCIADLATYVQWKLAHIRTMDNARLLVGSAFNGYYRTEHTLKELGLCSKIKFRDERINPIGSFLCTFLRMLAWEDASLRDLAGYFRLTGLAGSGMGTVREWPLTVYSPATKRRILKKAPSTFVGVEYVTPSWDEWCRILP